MMMRFLRTLFGCSRREAAYQENWERDRAERAQVRAQIREQVRQIEAVSREAEAASRLMLGLKRDVTQW